MTQTLIDLIQQLSKPGARYRVGVWIVPPQLLGSEADFVARLPIECDCVNLRHAALKRLPKGTVDGRYSVNDLLQLVEDIVQQEIRSNCGILTQVDLFLAQFKVPQRDAFWQSVLTMLAHPAHGFIFALPEPLETHPYLSLDRLNQLEAVRILARL
jgi:hypothetical protein